MLKFSDYLDHFFPCTRSADKNVFVFTGGGRGMSFVCHSQEEDDQDEDGERTAATGVSKAKYSDRKGANYTSITHSVCKQWLHSAGKTQF